MKVNVTDVMGKEALENSPSREILRAREIRERCDLLTPPI